LWSRGDRSAQKVVNQAAGRSLWCRRCWRGNEGSDLGSFCGHGLRALQSSQQSGGPASEGKPYIQRPDPHLHLRTGKPFRSTLQPLLDIQGAETGETETTEDANRTQCRAHDGQHRRHRRASETELGSAPSAALEASLLGNLGKAGAEIWVASCPVGVTPHRCLLIKSVGSLQPTLKLKRRPTDDWIGRSHLSECPMRS